MYFFLKAKKAKKKDPARRLVLSKGPSTFMLRSAANILIGQVLTWPVSHDWNLVSMIDSAGVQLTDQWRTCFHS